MPRVLLSFPILILRPKCRLTLMSREWWFSSTLIMCFIQVKVSNYEVIRSKNLHLNLHFKKPHLIAPLQNAGKPSPKCRCTISCILFKIFSIHSDFQLFFFGVEAFWSTNFIILRGSQQENLSVSAFWERDVVVVPAPAEHELKFCCFQNKSNKHYKWTKLCRRSQT